MNTTLPATTSSTLDAVASILLRSFLITVGAMLFTWLVWLVAGDFVYSIHSRMIDLTREEFDIFFLYAMTFLKGLNVIFFLFPFLAIKWFLRGRR
jgi:hypothetical protein